MDKITDGKTMLFKLLDKLCKSLAEQGWTREEIAATLTLDAAEIADTVSEAFGE